MLPIKASKAVCLSTGNEDTQRERDNLCPVLSREYRLAVSWPAVPKCHTYLMSPVLTVQSPHKSWAVEEWDRHRKDEKPVSGFAKIIKKGNRQHRKDAELARAGAAQLPTG